MGKIEKGTVKGEDFFTYMFLHMFPSVAFSSPLLLFISTEETNDLVSECPVNSLG